MVRSTVAHVDLQAIQSNSPAITAFLASEAPGGRAPSVIAVVKANAYVTAPGPWPSRSSRPAPACWRAPTSKRRSCCARRACAPASSGSAR